MKGKLIVFAALVALAVAAIVALLVISANDPPIAESCDVATQEDTPTSIVIAGSDEDADQLTFSVTTGPSHGRLSGTVPALTYSPDTNFNGSGSFFFQVNYGAGDSAVAPVAIKVSPVHESPKAYYGNGKKQEG